MSPSDILKRSWTITTERDELHVYGTMSALFSILFALPRLHYILRTDLIGWERIYELLRTVLGSSAVAGTTVVGTFVTLYIISFLTSVLADGAIISSIAKTESSGEPVSGRTAFGLGVQSFLRLVEFKLATSAFSVSWLTLMILLIDFYSSKYLDGVSIVRQFLPLTVFISVVVLTLAILFTYAEVHFVVERSSIPEALRRSTKLVVFYLQETFILMTLLALIFLRTLVNVALVFFLPGAVVALTTLLTQSISPELSLTILVVVGIITLWLAARISGVLLVFTHAVWTLTYLALRARTDHVILHEKAPDGEVATRPESPKSGEGEAPHEDLASINQPIPVQPATDEHPIDRLSIRVLPGRGPTTESIFPSA